MGMLQLWHRLDRNDVAPAAQAANDEAPSRTSGKTVTPAAAAAKRKYRPPLRGFWNDVNDVSNRATLARAMPPRQGDALPKSPH